jgi:putative transcriptional regulator
MSFKQIGHPTSGSFQPERQRDMNKTFTTTVTHPDGRRTKTYADGRVEELPPDPSQVIPEHLYENADAPITPERLARMKPIPRSKTLRRALGLTQEEFADRYGIPLGTLRDWEQGRSEPEASTRSYLRVIAKNPEMVRLALAS